MKMERLGSEATKPGSTRVFGRGLRVEGTFALRSPGYSFKNVAYGLLRIITKDIHYGVKFKID